MIWPSGEYGHPDEARSIALEATDYAIHKVEPQIISKPSWLTIVQPTKQFAIRTNYRKSLEDRINGLSSFNHSSY